MNQFSRNTVLLAAAVALAGCSGANSSGQTDSSPPLQGATIGGPFTLTDQDGKTVTSASFAGKYRVMYFGYTYCPDVCPVDMQHLGQGMRMLAKSDPGVAAKVVPIFVSVDPERDTPSVLKQYVAAFYPTMVGLTGSDQAIAKTAKEYHIFYQKVPAKNGSGQYLINHSQVAYLMSPENKPIALVPVDESAQSVADTLRRWVS